MPNKQDQSDNKLQNPRQLSSDLFNQIPQNVLNSFWLEYSSDSVVLLDTQGNILMLNKTAAAFFGEEIDDILGKPINSFRYGEVEKTRERQMAQVIETGQGTSYERRVIHNGKEIVINSRIEPVKGPDGNVIAVFVMAVNAPISELAKAAVVERESRYRALFEHSREGIIILDNERNIIDVNPRLLEIVGLEKEVFIKNTLDTLLAKNSIPLLHKFWELLLEKGEVNGTWDISPETENAKHLKFYAIANITPGEHILAIEDISARRRAEEELILSEERYSRLVEESPSSIIVVQDGKFVFANPKAAEVFGYDKPEDLIGVEYLSVLSAKSKQAVLDRVKLAESGHRNKFSLFELHRRDGSTRLIESSSVPYTYNGKPAVLAFGYDVTQYEFTATRLSSFYQVAPLGACVMVDGSFVEINQQLCDMTGYKAEELIGNTARMLHFNKEEYDRVVATSIQQLEEIGLATIETTYRRKDGKEIHVVVNSIRLDQQDPSKGVSVTSLDITKRKKAEEALQQLNEELEERVIRRTAELQQRTQDLESFSYAISHDLRGPLRAINGFAQILLNEHKGESEESIDMLNRILAAGKRMDVLIEGLLLLAELGQQNLSLELIDLGEIAKQIYRYMIPKREIETEFQSGSKVWADRGLMKVALSHLLANAIQYTQGQEKATIKFGYKTMQDGETIFYLQDNGVGFAPSLADKLFVPFQRLEENIEFEGLGLGLAVVQKVIERHHGEIWAEGRKGRGATFFFKLRTSPDLLPDAI